MACPHPVAKAGEIVAEALDPMRCDEIARLARQLGEAEAEP